MTFLEAILLGIVEGLTEYLPVSSTGHLLLAETLLGVGQGNAKEAMQAYTVFIQGGAILAVLYLYWDRIRKILSGVITRNSEGRALLLQLIAAFVPAAVLGLLFEKRIKEYLFGLGPTAVAWFIGGVVILGFTYWKKNRSTHDGLDLASLSLQKSLLIGCMQCLAMWPGVSRSLVTILGGIFVGLRTDAAIEFSFLLGALTLTAATGYEIVVHGSLMLEHFSLPIALTGVAVAFISAIIAVKWLVRYLSDHNLNVFAYYRIGLGLFVGIYLWVII